MQKVNTFFDYTTHAKPAEVIEKMSGQTAVRLFKQKYPDIDDETLFANQNRLALMAKEFNNCSTCMSLSCCKNSLHGYYYGLQVDKIGKEGEEVWSITEILKSCKKHGRKN